MRDWTGNKTSWASTLGANTYSKHEREINDYYATDPHALEIFLDKIKKDGINLHHNIWECACGQGHLSKVLIENNYNVKSTDLIDRNFGQSEIDFLKQNEKFNGDILTNPPYKYAKEFVEKSMDLIDDGFYCIMFLKIQFLEGQARRKLFENYPPKFVYVNSTRQLCAMNGNFGKYKSKAICYCWYIWEKGFHGEPTIRWI